MAACSAKTNDVERLECFDQLASKRGVAGPKVEAVSGTGKWQVRTETSPVDDSKTIILALPA
jgi:type VI secretion system protein VasI